MNLTARLTRELKAGGAKTAVLGVLLLVGIYFWVPPVWRALAGPAAATTAEIVPETPGTSPTAEPVTPVPGPPVAVAWHEAERLRTEDELFRSADAAELQANAFVFDGGFLPIDVAFGEEDPKAAVAEASETRADADAAEALAARQAAEPAPLTLKSTMIGPARRVAIINDRAYSEGMVVSASGRNWTLLNVEPRRVLLDGEGGTLELRIDPFAAGRTGL